MSVRMRHTKGHTRNRRAHHSLEAPRLSICKDCGASHLRHKICENCGNYRGKNIIDVTKKLQKKVKRAEAKAKSLGKEAEKTEKKTQSKLDKKKEKIEKVKEVKDKK